MEKIISRNVTIGRLKDYGVPLRKFPLLEQYRERADISEKKGDPSTALNYKIKAVELLMLLEKFEKVEAEADFYHFSPLQLREIAINAAENRIGFVGFDSARKIVENYEPDREVSDVILKTMVAKHVNKLRRKGRTADAKILETDASCIVRFG